MKKVSIIIPVYNCERYLPDCIKTVINQTYQNIEVILIDDESTDNSGKLCDNYAQKYEKIKVIHQNNAGPGYARNTGLEICNGEYFTFVDADDYISLNMISHMVEQIEKYDVDLVEVGNVYMLETRNTFRDCDGQVQFFQDENINSKYGKELRATVWGRLYRTKLVGHIRFSDKRIGEDCEYAGQVLNCCKSVVKYNQCLYGYRAYHDSITRGGFGTSGYKELKKIYKSVLVSHKESNKIQKEYEEKLQKLLQMISYRGQEVYYQRELNALKTQYENLTEGIFEKNEYLLTEISKANQRAECGFFKYSGVRIKHTITIICAKMKDLIKYKYALEQ